MFNLQDCDILSGKTTRVNINKCGGFYEPQRLRKIPRKNPGKYPVGFNESIGNKSAQQKKIRTE